MGNEELIALIERRFDELQFLLLDPEEQIRRIERGGTPVNEQMRRITNRLSEFEDRLDEVRPGPSMRMAVKLLEDRVKKAERAQAAFEVRLAELEKSSGSTSGREPTDPETPR